MDRGEREERGQQNVGHGNEEFPEGGEWKLLLVPGTMGDLGSAVCPAASPLMDENQMAANCWVLLLCFICRAEGATISGLGAVRGAQTVTQVPAMWEGRGDDRPYPLPSTGRERE